VHLHKDLPELLGQVQPLQLAQVAAAEQVRLEFADFSIRNIQALNALQAVTAAMDFHIQFLDQLPITAVVVAAELITTPARRLILDMAATAAAETEQMRIEETEPLVKQIQVVAVAVATGKQVAQMVDLELLLFVIPFHRVLRSLLHLKRTLWCLSEQLAYAHGQFRQQFLQFNTSLLEVAVEVAVTQLAAVAPGDYLPITVALL
jgi:hypothetical protein